MENKILDYIKNLSLSDSKTLSQKALKVSEEAGELAKVILPFDNAAGTIHRFVEKEKILEESVDVMLTAMSIPFELGFTMEDINEMMWRKAEKWQSIQAKEKKIEFPIPYEIHVTVDISSVIPKIVDIEQYKKDCKTIGVKPIVLDLENNGESVMKDAMTSSHYIGDNVSAYLECNRISSTLNAMGYNIIRRKIETVPWHPAAPTKEGDKMPEDCYFEAHIGCIITKEQKDSLNYIANINGAHLSRNFFKKLEDNQFVNMITLRKKTGTYSMFEEKVEILKKQLKENNIDFEKVITEFSIYDTKVSHDFKWLNKQKENVV